MIAERNDVMVQAFGSLTQSTRSSGVKRTRRGTSSSLEKRTLDPPGVAGPRLFTAVGTLRMDPPGVPAFVYISAEVSGSVDQLFSSQLSKSPGRQTADVSAAE